MSTRDITVPDIGDFENVEIIEVLVGPGDRVAVDDSLLTLESDKASMEVPASQAGTIASLSVAVGDSVNSGSVIGQMEVDEAGTPATDADSRADHAPALQSREQATDAGGGGGRQSSQGASPDADGKGDQGTHAEADTTSLAPHQASTPAGRLPSPTAHLDDASVRRAHASPSVRRYAREHGADLSVIQGTGPKARILKGDVQAFIKQAMEGLGSNYGGAASQGAMSGAMAAGMMGIPPIPEVDFSKFGEIERVDLGRINKLSAANLHRAWLNVPMVTHHDEADITEMEAFRKELKAEARDDDPKVTGLAFQMKALAVTLKRHPRLNASLSADGEALFYKKYTHIGIAVDTPNGLVVPVFRDVDKKSINELAIEMADVSTRARNKKLKPAEMQGASMTISSLGGIGGTAFTPIVNAPEVAILGITRAKMQPVWNGKDFEPRLICPLDLSYDHRVVDGADAARFMADYCRVIGDVRRLLL